MSKITPQTEAAPAAAANGETEGNNPVKTPDKSPGKEVRWHADVVDNQAVNNNSAAMDTPVPAAPAETSSTNKGDLDRASKAVSALQVGNNSSGSGSQPQPQPSQPQPPPPETEKKKKTKKVSLAEKLAKANAEHVERKAANVREAVKAHHEGLTRELESSDDEEEDEKVLEQSPDGKYYKVNQEIGRGSFKAVYRGLDANTGVAIAWCELMVSLFCYFW